MIPGGLRTGVPILEELYTLDIKGTAVFTRVVEICVGLEATIGEGIWKYSARN